MGESTDTRATLRFDRRLHWSFAALPSPQTLGCWPVASWMMR